MHIVMFLIVQNNYSLIRLKREKKKQLSDADTFIEFHFSKLQRDWICFFEGFFFTLCRMKDVCKLMENIKVGKMLQFIKFMNNCGGNNMHEVLRFNYLFPGRCGKLQSFDEIQYNFQKFWRKFWNFLGNWANFSNFFDKINLNFHFFS